MQLFDTIAAICTPPGNGAIGIIRISGKDAKKIALRIFSPKFKKNKRKITLIPYRLTLGNILIDKRPVDEVLMAFFKQPNSYTGEDIVEIFAHGGFSLLNIILETLLKNGARLASPGEFTKRAFLNGKIDLTKAEAVLEIINAPTISSAQNLAGQLDGKLAIFVKNIQTKLKSLLALVNAEIDFGEEGIDFFENSSFERHIDQIKNTITQVLQNAESSIIAHHGFALAISGNTNVGKSSLFNALVQKEQAIVSNIAGTTRDVVNAQILIAGVKFEILDTAGMRKSAGVIEKKGIAKSLAAISSANIILWVIDAKKPTYQSLYNALDANYNRNKKFIIIINKIDLIRQSAFKLPDRLKNQPIIFVSVKTGQGLKKLNLMLQKLSLATTDPADENAVIFNTRQKNSLQRVEDNLKITLKSLKNKAPHDIIAQELTNALNELDFLVGKITNEDLLDEIFANFCIGK